MLLLNHTCTVSRDTPVGTNGRMKMQLYKTGIRCLALPMGSAVTIQNEMQMGRGFEVSMGPGEDIKVGDQLSCNGMTLSVKYIRDYTNVPPVSHLELVCEQVI